MGENIVLDSVVALTALYGAALSTYVLYKQRSDSRPKLEVLIEPTKTRVHRSVALKVIARNTGSKDITLSKGGIVYPQEISFNAERISFPDNPIYSVNFPYELKSGKNCMIQFTYEELSTDLQGKQEFFGKVELYGYFEDQLGNIFTSKTIQYDMDQPNER